MLSSTNTITDIKAKLRNGFAFYGYADDSSFVSALEESVDNVVRTEMYPALSHMRSNTSFSTSLGPIPLTNVLDTGKTIYNLIAAKNKVDLSTTEEYVYWAEVYFAMSDFLSRQDHDSQYSVDGDSYSISTKGYSASVTGGTKASGKKDIAARYYDEGSSLMTLAGSFHNSTYRGGR